MLETRNVAPYYEIPVYRATGFNDLPGRLSNGKPTTTGYVYEPEVRTLQSASMQLNCIPDQLIVCVRKKIPNLVCHDTDTYATMEGISINFNNQAGLLSSMTTEHLFRNSVQSGLANMSWDEFCGSVISNCGYIAESITMGILGLHLVE